VVRGARPTSQAFDIEQTVGIDVENSDGAVPARWCFIAISTQVLACRTRWPAKSAMLDPLKRNIYAASTATLRNHAPVAVIITPMA